MDLFYPRKLGSSCSNCDTLRATHINNPVVIREWSQVDAIVNKGNNKITELRTILQRESPNS